MLMNERIQSLRALLRLDAHHATERFGIVVSAFAVTLAMLVTGGVASAISNNAAKTSETALYNTTFKTSQTNISGKVAGVYVSPDRTRSLVLMQVGESDASKMSADAKNYQSFITGSDSSLGQQTLDSSMSGEVVVFGTTGYMGVVVTSDRPFSKQILALTMRANSKLVYNDDAPAQIQSSRPDLKNDASFVKFDQWRVFFNPGASGAVTSGSLSNASAPFSASDVYYDLVVKSQEQEARKKMDADLAKMQVDLAQINEYTAQMATTQVGGVRIVAPKVPAQIAGDDITGKSDNASDPLVLHSAWTSPAGYNFDWRAGSIKTGYLNQLVPKGESYVKYLADHTAQAGTQNAGESSRGPKSFNVNDLVWKLSDGSDLATDYTGSSNAMKPLSDVMTNLVQAYQTYYNDKVAYQTQDFNQLIALEVSLKNVDGGASINDTKSAVQSY
ncbi:hypothetical protein [Arthrobacter bambusae]|uniref:Uncharacterized protein n=1 Tax=Arthrobacter bambusae TaxID=1338426 RepID=A0AAW8D2T0_9MICC|nr:hypothetical protein [Arthrobacter bambusae]MDP9903206.1 hypothetical protein [Arthrobacter bambusae]MDQ0128800.1 hypothetical protein [Arthrobacter bambusae]MDQ0180141.1 hypothetical protein [Arthrobacter bambusae]